MGDWFEATLGEPMFYSSAFFKEYFGEKTEAPFGLGAGDPDMFEDGWRTETLETAQLRKMEYIVHAMGVKPGMQALDIGSGWGRFAEYLASKGANVTGVVSAHDLAKYARRLNKHHGEKVRIIAKFNTFLKKVHSLLKDGGTFYIQCSGLQRGYAKGYNNYHELVWGMFMEQHIFPGAGSSTPLGWIATHLERAGFEVQAAH